MFVHDGQEEGHRKVYTQTDQPWGKIRRGGASLISTLPCFFTAFLLFTGSDFSVPLCGGSLSSLVSPTLAIKKILPIANSAEAGQGL